MAHLTGKAKNIRKTINYLRKNGLRHTYYAVQERMREERAQTYVWQEPTEEELAAQRRLSADWPWLFSIVVPAYETKEAFLGELIDSVCRQSYAGWELIIADASKSDTVERVVGQAIKEMTQTSEKSGMAQEKPGAAIAGCIRYLRLHENRGISENTNEGIAAAAGDYIALLDHDDFLSPDALYYMAAAVQEGERKGVAPVLVYSDEDKYENSTREFAEPHRKQKFNLDLILSNNYICHFMAIESKAMKILGLRRAYDGAQDYDLILRIIGRLWKEDGFHRACFDSAENKITHVPRVLYHWRCHSESTAENTASKTYAYVAGREALADFCKLRGWRVNVWDSLHLGFYDIEYIPDLLSVREDVGVVGGRLIGAQHRICGGIYDEKGSCPYEGLHKEFSGGSTHRAVLQQECTAVDIRCMRLRPELQRLYTEITGLPYREKRIASRAGVKMEKRKGKQEIWIADISGLNCDEAGYRKLSMELCRAAAERGYRIVWNPKISMLAVAGRV